MSYNLLGGIFLGWSLGANDAANVFGTAVESRMISFMSAALMCSGFVLLGSIFEGQAGIQTIGNLSSQTLYTATLSSVGAAISITAMTIFRIPSSTSQAMVGSIIGIGLVASDAEFVGLAKVVACWIGTPIGALLIAIALYLMLGKILNAWQPTIYHQDTVMRACLILSGGYGAYALGANNVANVTAVYVGAGVIDSTTAAWLGGASIALGTLTYSRPVMNTVGRKIVRLDAFSALVVVLAEAIVVHFYAWVGVPVSTSQAVVGAVIGVGLIKQATAIRGAVVLRILMGWVATPIIAALVSMLLYFVTHLQYVP
ncbi:MAG: anion permease [Pseudomonadota bacterium]